jgi:hypothetical protein
MLGIALSVRAIILAESRSTFRCTTEDRSVGRVEYELTDLLRTAAGDGDLGSPLQRLLA